MAFSGIRNCSLPAAGLFSRSRLRGTQGSRLYTTVQVRSRRCSVARALGLQSREIWQVITGSFREVRAEQDNGKPVYQLFCPIAAKKAATL